MPEDKTKVEETTIESDTQETKDTEETTVEDVKIDYDKELQEEVEKFEHAEKNREGYQKRKAKTEGETEEIPDIQAQVEAAIAKALPQIVPKLQSTMAEDVMEGLLNEYSGGDPAKRKLLLWNFENKVSANGTMRERMENALLITDKKAIQKKQTEMATALKNRAGLGASGMGSSTEGQQVADNILSTDQLRDLKTKGWDDKKIERFKKNLRR